MLVVRPHPGQAVTLGAKERRPSACRISQAAYTSSRRSPPGRGVSDTRMVSPMPSFNKMPMAAADHTRPFVPMPASVRPRCSGCRVCFASGRYTSIRWRGRDTLQEMMIWFPVSPDSRASSVDCRADSTMHSLMMSSDSRPRPRSAFSCIFAITSSWFREPPLTPMRTGLPWSRATWQMVENCSSRRFPVPTLPGLMRYLSSARAQSGNRVSRRWPL